MMVPASLVFHLHDMAPDALSRLPHHILRAQRYSWLAEALVSDADTPAPSPPAGRKPTDGPVDSVVEDLSRLYHVEADGRVALARRRLLRGVELDKLLPPQPVAPNAAPGASAGLPLSQSETMMDVTVDLQRLERGSLVAELGILVSGLAAVTIAWLFAQQMDAAREFKARLRQLEIVQELIASPGLSSANRTELIKYITQGVGLYSRDVVAGFKLKMRDAEVTMFRGADSGNGDRGTSASGDIPSRQPIR